MRSKKRTVVVLAIVIVVLMVVTSGLLVYRNQLTERNQKENNILSNDTAQQISSTQKIIKNFYDKPITDEKIALDSIELNRNQLGYGNKDFSFEFERKEEWMGASYSFKLLYKGIPVYDRGISVITYSDYSANILITGGVEVEKISKIDIAPKITQDEALDIAKETLGEDFSEYNISANFKHVKISPQLIIYETKNQYVLSYIYSGNYICIIDAQNGNVIESHSSLVFNSAEYEGQNGDIHQVFYDDYKDDNYDIKNLLWNKDKNIYIFDDVEGAQDYIPINIFTIDDIQSGKNKSAVDAMANTYRVIEYFEKSHNMAFDATLVEVNDDDEVKNNSGGRSWVTASGSSVANIIFGVYSDKKTQDSCNLDDVAHEYTHAVTNLLAFGNGYRKDSKYFERNALMEAYSDIFGQLVEQKYTGKTDWIQSDTMRNMELTVNYILRYKPKDDDYGGAHQNSTIISHTAYLMSKDNYNENYDAEFLLDYDQLGQLWYRSLTHLKDMELKNFSDCRWAIEQSARELIEEGVLLEGNLKVIEQAFNEVGVDSDAVRHSVENSLNVTQTTKSSTLVVPVETETVPLETVEITEIATTETINATTTTTTVEPTTEITAIDLINKSVPEIIGMMGGTYEVIPGETDTYIYIANESVISGMQFKVEVDWSRSYHADGSINEQKLRNDLEQGFYHSLNAIEVFGSAYATSKLSANMNYEKCCSVLDSNLECSVGTIHSGAPDSEYYTFKINDIQVELHFNAISELLYNNVKFSYEDMMRYNPNINCIILKNPERTVTTEPPTEALTESTTESNKSFSISDYAGTYSPTDTTLYIGMTIEAQSESSAHIYIEITNSKFTHLSENNFTGNVDSNPFTFEVEDGFGRNQFTLEFRDGAIYMTAKCIECYDTWGIAPFNQVELVRR